MHSQFDHKYKLKRGLRILGILLLCFGILVPLAACRPKTTIRPINYSRPSETAKEKEQEEQSKESRKAKKSEKASKKETETTYDMSGEFDPGNLQGLVGGGFKSFAGQENGPGVAGLSTAVNQFLQERGLSG